MPNITATIMAMVGKTTARAIVVALLRLLLLSLLVCGDGVVGVWVEVEEEGYVVDDEEVGEGDAEGEVEAEVEDVGE